MFVTPWRYQDEMISSHDLTKEWRNGPLGVLGLASFLRSKGHKVCLVDMERLLVQCKGVDHAALEHLRERISRFVPDIIGFSFYSVHFTEVKRTVEHCRRVCAQVGISPLFVAGGVHASVEPVQTVRDLDLDCAVAGEGERALSRLADGEAPETICGVVTRHHAGSGTFAEAVGNLDSLPFPAWELCDYKFYAHPSSARLKFRMTESLDIQLGRGCPYRCSFCAYGYISKPRFHSVEYVVDHIRHMMRTYGVSEYYFTDGSVGTNRSLLVGLCERIISEGLHKRIHWYANMRVDQVDQQLLKLMKRAGCGLLFYGFETGSQRVLDAMAKKTTVEENFRVAELHLKVGMPYFASFILGHPSEQVKDIKLTQNMIVRLRQARIGINAFVPLPGSKDYYTLLRKGVIAVSEPTAWRSLGECNPAHCYADMERDEFMALYGETVALADRVMAEAGIACSASRSREKLRSALASVKTRVSSWLLRQ